MSRILSRIAPLLMLWLCAAATAWAQATGTIDGTVFDKSGAVVPGAAVTVTNVNTNLVRRVKSDGAGKYTITFLPVGVYNVLVEKEGFAGSLQKDVELQVNTTVQVNAEMNIRSSTEQVNVTAEQTLVQSTSTTLVQVVDQKRIEDLPLNGRNVLQPDVGERGRAPEKCGRRRHSDPRLSPATSLRSRSTARAAPARISCSTTATTTTATPTSRCRFPIRTPCRSSASRPAPSTRSTGAAWAAWSTW